MKEQVDTTEPTRVAIFKGAVEKAVMPFIAYLNNDQKLHFVSPAALSTS